MNSSINNVKTIFFYIFVFVLILFLIRTIFYWVNAMETRHYYNDYLLFLSNISLIGVCLASFLFLKHRKSFINIILFLLVLDLLLIILRNEIVTTDIPKMITWPILFLIVSGFTSENKKYVAYLRTVFLICVIIGTVYFLSHIMSNDFSRQTNVVYFPVLAIPVLMLNKNRTYAFSMLTIATVFAIIGMKRSMLLSMALVWLLLLSFYVIKQKKFLNGILISMFISLIAYNGINYIDSVSGGYYTERFNMDDQSNGREDIYDITWLMIIQSSPDDLWLGHGYNATARDSILDRAAHNDFLETLYDYGIVGVTFLVLFWFYIIAKWIWLYRHDSPNIISYTMSLCILLVMSMVSVLILYNSYYNFLIIYFAIVEALEPGFKKVYKGNG